MAADSKEEPIPSDICSNGISPVQSRTKAEHAIELRRGAATTPTIRLRPRSFSPGHGVCWCGLLGVSLLQVGLFSPWTSRVRCQVAGGLFAGRGLGLALVSSSIARRRLHETCLPEASSQGAGNYREGNWT